MKTALLVFCTVSFLTFSVSGQIPSGRKIVDDRLPKEEQAPAAETAPTEVPAEAPPAEPAPAVTPEKPVQPTPQYVMPPIRPKTAEELAEIERKTVEFQMKRAQDGSATAQYDLGMRYLNGEGVEQNEDAARQLLNAAAQQGHTAATQKLLQLGPKQQPASP